MVVGQALEESLGHPQSDVGRGWADLGLEIKTSDFNWENIPVCYTLLPFFHFHQALLKSQYEKCTTLK